MRKKIAVRFDSDIARQAGNASRAVRTARSTSSCGTKSSAPPPAGPAPMPAKGAVPWPAPDDPMQLTRKAGLTPEQHEFVFLHVRAHLDVFVNGAAVTVPAGIGIEIHDPAVRQFKA